MHACSPCLAAFPSLQISEPVSAEHSRIRLMGKAWNFYRVHAAGRRANQPFNASPWICKLVTFPRVRRRGRGGLVRAAEFAGKVIGTANQFLPA